MPLLIMEKTKCIKFGLIQSSDIRVLKKKNWKMELLQKDLNLFKNYLMSI